MSSTGPSTSTSGRVDATTATGDASPAPEPESPRRVLGLVAGGNFAQLGARLALAPVVPLVLVAFDATKSTVGLALGGMWAVYALAQFPGGVLGDRFGERAALLAALAGTALGCAALAVAPTLLAFGLAAVLLGAGAGLFFPAASSLLTRLFAGHGSALGTMTAAGAVAGVCYPLAAGALGVRYGWRAAPAVAAVATLAVLVATLVVVPRMAAVRPDRRLRDAFDSGLLGGLLSRPAVVYSIGVAVVGGYTFQAVSSFLPTFLVEYRALGTGEASLALGGVFALSAVAQPVAGRVSDARSRDLAIGASFALTAVGVGTLVVVPSLPGMVAGTVLLGVGVSWPGSVQARLMDQLDDAERGLGFGAVRTVYLLLSALGSAVTGALADAGGWPLAYGAVIVLLAACLLAMTLNRRVGPGL